jgi:hypothetical protein
MPKIILSSLTKLLIQLIEKSLNSIKAIRFNPLWHALFIIISFVLLIYQVNDRNVGSILNSFTPLTFIPILILATIQILFEINIWHEYFKANEISIRTTVKIVFESYLTKIAVTGATGELLTRSVLIDKIKVKKLIKIQLSHSLQQTISSLIISGIMVLIFIQPTVLYFDTLLYYFFVTFGIVLAVVAGFVLIKFDFIRSILTQKLAYMGRVLIYFSQFSFIIWTLGPMGNEFLALGGIALFFIIKTFLPIYNVAGGIGLREVSLLGIFTLLKIDPSPILIGSVLIWLTNHFLPVFIMFSYKLFSKWSISFSEH